MANPQIENGHVDIANEIIEHLASYRLSGEEWQVLLVVLRKTWGWKKKSDCISLSQFQRMTKMKRPSIIRALKKLIDKNICSKKATTIANEYRFNKDFETWTPGSKKATPVAKKLMGSSKKANKSSSKRATYKRKLTKETITKERRKRKKRKKRKTREYAEYVFLTEEEYQRFINEYGETNTKKFIEKLDNYKGANGKEYDDDNRAIRNWVIDEVMGKQTQNKFDAAKEQLKREKEAQGG